MKGQLYKISISLENAPFFKPAQFVYENVDSNIIVGFVSSYDSNKRKATICLFESAEIPDNAFDVIESIPGKKMFELFNLSLKENPYMAHEWQILLENKKTGENE